MIDEVEEYIRHHHSMVLACIVDGEARASTAGFALGPNMQIYFLVFRDSLKHRGVTENRQVSLVVDDGFRIPMRGVEIIGRAEEVHGAERQQGQQLLTERFPDLKTVWDDPRILIVRVTADRVRYTDWVHGVGQSREASFTHRAAS